MSKNVVDCGAKEEDHDSHATIIWAGWVDMQGLVVTPQAGLKIQIQNRKTSSNSEKVHRYAYGIYFDT